MTELKNDLIDSEITYQTSLPPWAKLPNVAVKICKNENNCETSSGSSVLMVVSVLDAINGTLLEFGDKVAASI